MKVYHYNRDGYYQSDSLAFPNPLVPSEYLVPAYSTLVSPPAFQETQTARWVEDHWEITDDPKYLAEQEQKANGAIVVFYRDVAGKDQKVIAASKWGASTDHWKDSEPKYNGNLVSHVSNSGIGWCIVGPGNATDCAVKNENGEPLKKIVNGNVVDRDSADINSEDAVYKNGRKVVFFRKVEGKDTKVIRVSSFGQTSDATGSVLLDGHSVPGWVGFKIFDIIPEGLFSTENVPLMKLVDGKFIPRDPADIERDSAWKPHILGKFNRQVGDLMGDKSAFDHTIENSSDLYAVLKSVMIHLGITDSHLEAAIPGSSSAKHRLDNQSNELHQKLNKFKNEKNLAMAKLES